MASGVANLKNVARFVFSPPLAPPWAARIRPGKVLNVDGVFFVFLEFISQEFNASLARRTVDQVFFF